MKIDVESKELREEVADELEEVAELLREENLSVTEPIRIKGFPRKNHTDIIGFEVTYYDDKTGRERTLEMY
jgi:hypothetical protein